MKRSKRKDFLKEAVQFGSSLLLLSFLPKSIFEIDAKGKEISNSTNKAPLPDGESPVSESDPTSSALGFHHDAKQTNFVLYPERKLPISSNQICKHCSHFKKVNEGWGKCQILTNGVVSSGGWCSAWSSREG